MLDDQFDDAELGAACDGGTPRPPTATQAMSDVCWRSAVQHRGAPGHAWRAEQNPEEPMQLKLRWATKSAEQDSAEQALTDEVAKLKDEVEQLRHPPSNTNERVSPADGRHQQHHQQRVTQRVATTKHPNQPLSTRSISQIRQRVESLRKMAADEEAELRRMEADAAETHETSLARPAKQSTKELPRRPEEAVRTVGETAPPSDAIVSLRQKRDAARAAAASAQESLAVSRLRSADWLEQRQIEAEIEAANAAAELARAEDERLQSARTESIVNGDTGDECIVDGDTGHSIDHPEPSHSTDTGRHANCSADCNAECTPSLFGAVTFRAGRADQQTPAPALRADTEVETKASEQYTVRLPRKFDATSDDPVEFEHDFAQATAFAPTSVTSRTLVREIMANLSSDLSSALLQRGADRWTPASIMAAITHAARQHQHLPTMSLRIAQIESTQCNNSVSMEKHVSKVVAVFISAVELDAPPRSMTECAGMLCNAGRVHEATALCKRIADAVINTLPDRLRRYLILRPGLGSSAVHDARSLEFFTDELIRLCRAEPRSHKPATVLVVGGAKKARLSADEYKSMLRSGKPPSAFPGQKSCAWCRDKAAMDGGCDCADDDHFNSRCPHHPRIQADKSVDDDWHAKMRCEDCKGHHGHPTGSPRCWTKHPGKQ